MLFYEKEEESIDHLLIYCDMASAVWHLLLSLFSVHWVLLLAIVKGVLLSWHGSFVGRKRKEWRIAPLCLFWMVWQEGNKRAFNNKENYVHWIKLKFLCNIWSWSSIFMTQGPSSFVDWLGMG